MCSRLRPEKDARPGTAAQCGMSGSATSCARALAVQRGSRRRWAVESGLRMYALGLLAAGKEVCVKFRRSQRSVTSRPYGLIGSLRVWPVPRL